MFSDDESHLTDQKPATLELPIVYLPDAVSQDELEIKGTQLEQLLTQIPSSEVTYRDQIDLLPLINATVEHYIGDKRLLS